MNAPSHPWPICEGLVVTGDERGKPHLAPMGPHISPDGKRLTLRPFRTSQTYANLNRDRHGVFHVTDDVELLAHAAIGGGTRALENDTVEFAPLDEFPGWSLPAACRWAAFRVIDVDDSGQRSIMQAEVVLQRRQRDFFGFNRAKHAVVEAAILATRVGILDDDEIDEQLRRLAPLVEKTGGAAEHRAFALLTDYITAARTKLAASEH